MSYQICGNIITQRKPDGTLKKVAYDTGSSYIDLFAEMQALNQPHLDRLHQVFEWLDSNKSIACELGDDLSPITILQKRVRPDHRSVAMHAKHAYLAAYNSYYEVNYHPQEVGLDA